MFCTSPRASRAQVSQVSRAASLCFAVLLLLPACGSDEGSADGASGRGSPGSGGNVATQGGSSNANGGALGNSGGAPGASGQPAAGGSTSGGASAAGSGGQLVSGGSGGGPGGSAGAAAGGSSTGGSATTAGGAGGAAGALGASGAGGATVRPTEVWVAPDGNDANPGTEASPMQTICDTTTKVGACYKICPSSYSCPATGATIWVKGGTYKITKKIDIGATRPGVAGGLMKLFAVAGAKPILDASGLDKADVTKTGVAIHLKGSYWHVKGIEIISAPHNCVKVEGGYNIIESVVVHGCGNTGITIGAYAGEDVSAGPGTGNTILNCDSYANVGANNNGEDADGFGAKELSGKNNVFRGCRAWNNADDGFDFYGWADPITVEGSWALESGKMGASGGDGNGFKLGKGAGNHVLKDAIAAHNAKRGYTNNGATQASTCTNCKGCSNTEGLNDTGDRAVAGSVTELSPCLDLTKAKGARKADGSLPAL